MAQTTQIIPKYSFPYVETHINDHTEVDDGTIADTVDTSVHQAYVITSAKGIDNTWVKKTNRESAVKSFGESNFKKYGQPLMQALNVLDQDDPSTVYIMRVMPENAAYANAVLNIGYKADDSSVDAKDRKFRIKLESKSYENITTKDQLLAKLQEKLDADGEGYSHIPAITFRYTGRGKCGNTYSARISAATTYEEQYGIKVYDFEIMDLTNGLTKDFDYIGSLVVSPKYADDSVMVSIDELLNDAEIGLPPLDVHIDEDQLQVVYDAYVAFIKQLHLDLQAEYEQKVAEYAIPEDQMNNIVPVEDQYLDEYNELKEIDDMIDQTSDTEIVDFDSFDFIYGKKVDSTDNIFGLEFVKPLTADVDTTAKDYNANDYTEDTNTVDFSSAKGITLVNGSDGYFETPRTIINSDGKKEQLTVADEIKTCMINAWSGVYDKRILSVRRMPLTILFDANYPFEVKQVMADLVLKRDSCPVRFDAGIINTLSTATVSTLRKKYLSFNDRLESVDIQNYTLREASTGKHVNVTINYFLAARFVYHYANNGFYIPFVKEITRLSGHDKNSLKPVIEDYDKDLKTLLYDNRFNYYEYIGEDLAQRAVQNTRQMMNSDLLEESNILILYTLKNQVELDTMDELYNFSEETSRQTFVNTEKAKYADWNSRVVQSIDFRFETTEYEFNHSILHLYLELTFRGLNKQAIAEININKRTYSSTVTDQTNANTVTDITEKE